MAEIINTYNLEVIKSVQVDQQLSTINDIVQFSPRYSIAEELHLIKKHPSLDYKWTAGSVDAQETILNIENLEKSKKEGWRPLSASKNEYLMTEAKRHFSKSDYIRLPGFILLGRLKIELIPEMSSDFFVECTNVGNAYKYLK